MLNGLILMILLGGTSALSIMILNWDIAKRADTGDRSGHKGRMLPIAKTGLSIVLGSALLIFVSLAANDTTTDYDPSGGDSEFECTGSMRC